MIPRHLAWKPPPRITLTFSEHVDENSDEHSLSLEYSTDTTDLDKASRQARNLTQRHLKNIARGIAKSVPSKHYSPYDDRNILIKALAIDTSRLKADEEKCSVFVKGEDDCKILLNILRLPDSRVPRKPADGDMIGMIEVQIPTQIDYREWLRTIGEPDRLPMRVTNSLEHRP